MRILKSRSLLSHKQNLLRALDDDEFHQAENEEPPKNQQQQDISVGLDYVLAREELPESGYLLTVMRISEAKSRQDSPVHILSEEESNCTARQTANALHQPPLRMDKFFCGIPRFKRNSFVIKPCVISSYSAKGVIKNTFKNSYVGRPLLMPPRLPRVNAGCVVGNGDDNTTKRAIIR